MHSRLVVALSGLLLLAGISRAQEIYTYVDENGVVHFTDTPDENLPYRPVDADTWRQEVDEPERSTAVTPRAHLAGLPPAAVRFQAYVREASELYDIAEELIWAVMMVESRLDRKAVSSAGACGLMQLMPATARRLGVRDVFDARQNILAGTRYLRKLADELGQDLALTLAAYNAGPEAVRRWGGVPPYGETKSYVKRVIGLWRSLSKGGKGTTGGKSRLVSRK